MRRIKRIKMQGFMSHADSTIDLPDTGVVVVSGKNGSGKSSMIEAVSMAFDGETLRGKPPWAGKTCLVAVQDYNGTTAARTRTGSKTVLTVNENAQPDPTAFENMTKAQEHLTSLVGQHDVWKRTSLFSSADAHSFTSASDGDRKRLLETILGLSRFDAASEACRSQLRLNERSLDEAKHTLSIRAEKLTSARARHQDAQQRLATLKPEPTLPLEDRRAELDAQIDALKQTINERSAEISELEANLTELRSQEDHARRHHDRVSAGECGTCHQPIPAADVAQAIGEYELAKAATLEARRVLTHKTNVADATLRQAREDMTRLSEERAEVRQRIRLSDAAQKGYTDAAHSAHTLAQNIVDAQDAVDESSWNIKQAGAKVAELEVAAKVLSLTGVRAHLLHGALAGIEQIANTWLTRIAGNGLALKLTPYTEKASGAGLKDSISLEVIGAGNGHGYKASSGGERRRIDIAIMLALADVAEAAHGEQPGTMFFDEVFDALDAEGIDAVCDVLEDIGQSRCVVVITHQPAMAQRLRTTALHLHVDAGVVT